MKKQSQFGFGNYASTGGGFSYGPPMRNMGVTLGTLEEAILADQRASMIDRQLALMRLQREVGHLPKNTPVDSILPKLGGGILGYLLGMYFGLSPVGKIVAGVAGWSLGDVLNKFYNQR